MDLGDLPGEGADPRPVGPAKPPDRRVEVVPLRLPQGGVGREHGLPHRLIGRQHQHRRGLGGRDVAIEDLPGEGAGAGLGQPGQVVPDRRPLDDVGQPAAPAPDDAGQVGCAQLATWAAIEGHGLIQTEPGRQIVECAERGDLGVLQRASVERSVRRTAQHLAGD